MKFTRIAVLGILGLLVSLGAYAKNAPYAMHPGKMHKPHFGRSHNKPFAMGGKYSKPRMKKYHPSKYR